MIELTPLAGVAFYLLLLVGICTGWHWMVRRGKQYEVKVTIRKEWFKNG